MSTEEGCRNGRARAPATVLVVGLLIAVPAASLVLSSANAQVPGCSLEALHRPLFITDVSFALVSGAATSVIGDHGAAYVAPGDEIAATVTVTNRVLPACGPAQQVATSHVTGLWSYPAAGVQEAALTGACTDLAAGTSCSALTTTFTVAPGPTGEHRIRFLTLATQDDGDLALAGAERVLVVDARPDLALSEIVWTDPAPEDRHTSYGTSGPNVFELSLANTGTYPAWNPNGGATYYGRSAFDGNADADEQPDHAVDGLGTEAVYTLASDRLPACITDDEDDEQGQPFSLWGPGLLCSYRRGARADITLHTWAAELGATEPIEDHVDHLGTGHDSTPFDKDDSLLHAGNVEGIASDLPVDLDALDRLRRAGAYELHVTATGAPPGTDTLDDTSRLEVDIQGVDLRIETLTVSSDDGACGTDGLAPCPAGTPLLLSAALRNAGDPSADTPELLDHAWKAGVYVNGELATGLDGEPLTIAFERVPATTDGPTLLASVPVIVPTPLTGGDVTVELRLDHPDNYQHDLVPIIDDQGRVVERSEGHACDAPVLDNTACTTIAFTEIGDDPTTDLPDLLLEHVKAAKRILTTDVLGGPVQPWAGQDISLRLKNIGTGPTDGPVHVTLTACPEESTTPVQLASGGCELVDAWNLDQVGGGRTLGLSTTWHTFGKLGDYELCATVHYAGDQLATDNDEACTQTFILVGGTGLGGGRVL